MKKHPGRIIELNIESQSEPFLLRVFPRFFPNRIYYTLKTCKSINLGH